MVFFFLLVFSLRQMLARTMYIIIIEKKQVNENKQIAHITCFCINNDFMLHTKSNDETQFK